MSTKPRNNSTTTVDKEDPWICDICKNVFSDRKARLLECQRCKLHFCIKCLNKPVTEYNILDKSDSMWFCGKCRLIVERNIVTDLKIEERCQEIMSNYENRITTLESEMMNKCDENKVREIIAEELVRTNDIDKVKEIVREEIRRNQEETATMREEAGGKETPQIGDVISELYMRKAREKNIIIYGCKEEEIPNPQERKENDKKRVIEIITECEVEVKDTTVSHVTRLGKYNPPENKEKEPNTSGNKKRPRPLLVTLENQELKASIFRNANKMKDKEGYTSINVANDLTPEERAKEKELHEEAK